MDRKLRPRRQKRVVVECVEGKERKETGDQDPGNSGCPEQELLCACHIHTTAMSANEYRRKARVCNEGILCNRDLSVKPRVSDEFVRGSGLAPRHGL